MSDNILGILVPDVSYMQVVDLGRLVINERSSEFEPEFLDGLTKSGYENEYGVMEYALLIKTDPKDHAYILETGDEVKLMEIKRDKGYNKYWFAINHFS